MDVMPINRIETPIRERQCHTGKIGIGHRPVRSFFHAMRHGVEKAPEGAKATHAR